MDTHECIRQAFVACVSGEVRARWVTGRSSMPARRRGARVGVVVMVVPLLGLALAGSASAFNYVVDANGTYWGIQDAAPPRVSIAYRCDRLPVEPRRPVEEPSHPHGGWRLRRRPDRPSRKV